MQCKRLVTRQMFTIIRHVTTRMSFNSHAAYYDTYGEIRVTYPK